MALSYNAKPNYDIMPLKRISFLVFTTCCVMTVSAQNVDGGATKFLEDVSAQYQKYATMQFQYTLKITQEQKSQGDARGEVAIKGNKYRATYRETEYLCDGTSVWNYDKSVNEVTVYEYDPDAENDLLNPQRMLSDWKVHFRAKYIRDEFVRNLSVALVDLTPKVRRTYYKIRLFIDNVNKRIVRMAMYDRNNTIYTLYIEQFKVNKPLADSSFVFDVPGHPGVEVNDMR